MILQIVLLLDLYTVNWFIHSQKSKCNWKLFNKHFFVLHPNQPHRPVTTWKVSNSNGKISQNKTKNEHDDDEIKYKTNKKCQSKIEDGLIVGRISFSSFLLVSFAFFVCSIKIFRQGNKWICDLMDRYIFHFDFNLYTLVWIWFLQPPTIRVQRLTIWVLLPGRPNLRMMGWLAGWTKRMDGWTLGWLWPHDMIKSFFFLCVGGARREEWRWAEIGAR